VTAVVTPIVHLNGTGGDALVETNTLAARRLNEALEALCEAAPNARDYYLHGGDAFAAAQKQHEERVSKLRGVLADLRTIRESIADQVDARTARR
jgi:hypothetical protein